MNEWKNDPFQRFVTKRKSFEYENESRAVTCLPNYGEASATWLSKTEEGTKKIFSKGKSMNSQELTDKEKYVCAALQRLVEKIYVAPCAESWFEVVIQSLLSKYQYMYLL